MPKKSAQKRVTKKKETVVLTDVKQEKDFNKILFWSLSILAFVVYYPTMQYGFVLDDVAVIQNNRFVQEGLSGIPDLFSTFYWKGFTDVNAGLYRPLSMMMFAIEWAISPDNPAIHHFVNILLYALTIGLLFKVLNKLLPNYSNWVSFAVALLFMLHPSHTEVVANIKSRDEILCFFFFLLTFQRLIKIENGTIVDHLKTGLLFLACLLSKEAGIMYLPIFGLYLLLVKQEKFVVALKQLAPLIIVSAGWLVLHQSVIHSDPFAPIPYNYQDNSLVLCEGGSRYATGIGILGKYLYETFVPFQLSYDYSYNQLPCLEFTSLPVILTLIVLLGAIFLFFKTYRTKPVIAFGISFFFISILLVTNLFSLIGTTYANRLIYAPSFGIILIVVIGVFSIFKVLQKENWKSMGVLFSVAVGLIFTFQTTQRYKVWESNTTLFTADVENSPNSSRVHFNYGVVLMNSEEGDSITVRQHYTKAIASFKSALAIDSIDVGSYKNLGVVYFRIADYKNSVVYTQRAIDLNPSDTSLYANLGDAYFALNWFEEATSAFEIVVQSRDASAANYNRYGTALFNLKKYALASKVFNDGLKKFPNDIEMAINLGNVYGASGQFEKAAVEFEKVFQKNTSNMNVLRFLIMCYTELGNKEKINQYSAYLR